MYNIANTIIENIKIAKEKELTPTLIYDRVSHVVQEDGRSLESQKRWAEDYVKRENLYSVYVFEVIESAKNEGRKIFSMMLKLAQQYRIKNLVFKNTDRMTRNFSDLILIEKLIKEQDYKIHFYQCNRVLTKDSTHQDWLMLGFETAFAKSWIDKISTDVKESYKDRAAQGIAPNAPYGYKFNRDTKKYIINKDVENSVRLIFDEFDTGKYTIAGFLKYLNSNNILTSTGRAWQKGNLYNTLTNPFYHGEFLFKGKIYQGIHEPYYSKDRWEKRTAFLSSGFVGTKKRDIDPELQRFLRCSCGRILTGEIKKNKYHYYKHKCLHSPKQVYIREEKVWKLIDEEVKKIRFSPDFIETIKALVSDIFYSKKKDNKSERAFISRQITDIETKRKKLLDLYAEGVVEKEDITKNLTQYNSDIKNLEKQREIINNSNDKFVLEIKDIIDYIRDMPLIYLNTQEKGKAQILRHMATGVVVNKDSVEILWKEPFIFLLSSEMHKYHIDDKKKDESEKVRIRHAMLPRQDSNL